jgi:hypothetical protein
LRARSRVFRARPGAICGYCGKFVDRGELARSDGLGGTVHARCTPIVGPATTSYLTKEELAKRKSAITGLPGIDDGNCHRCGRDYPAGTLVRKLARRWVHEVCQDPTVPSGRAQPPD